MPRGGGGADAKNMQINVVCGFFAVWSPSKVPRGMPEALAADPESISPRGGMATPFSPDLMFSKPRFGLAKARAEKSNLV